MSRATRNEHTGAKIQTGVPSDAYRDNYDRIFRNKKEKDQTLQHIEDFRAHKGLTLPDAR